MLESSTDLRKSDDGVKVGTEIFTGVLVVLGGEGR